MRCLARLSHAKELRQLRDSMRSQAHKCSNEITRLNKQQQTLDELRALFKTNRSNEALRHAMNAAVSPCIPHLGIFLGDLCVVDEFDSKSGEHVNFRKCRKIAGIIERLLAYQAKPYRLQPIEAMTDHMRRLPGRLPRRQAIQLSRKHEPKQLSPRR